MTGRKSPINAPNKAKGALVETEILEALGEFTDALENSEVNQRFRCRQIKLDLLPTPYNADLVKTTRQGLCISQAMFARLLGVSPKTMRSWELGVSVPQTVACRFMDEIRRDPRYWKACLNDVIVPTTNSTDRSS